MAIKNSVSNDFQSTFNDSKTYSLLNNVECALNVMSLLFFFCYFFFIIYTLF